MAFPLSLPSPRHPRCVAAGAVVALAALAIFSLAAQAQKPAPAPQIPTIRSTTTLVDVPVLVLDKRGQPLEMFSQGDFEVYDDGQLQHISFVDNQPRPVSLAIVVDTGDYDAIGQAKRSAQLLTTMVVGASGQASIFIPGPEPKQLIGFTGDGNVLANALTHLQKSPAAPQGQGSILEPLNLAILKLRAQPRQNTRAVLVISKSSDKSGVEAQALVESSMSDAIPIFHISPNRPKGQAAYVNPDSTDQGGTGVGSQRTQAPPAPVNSRGMPTSGSGAANMDLAPIIGAVAGLPGKVFAPHHMDYVYDSGGVYYSAGNDNEFDQKLSLIGDELRAIYHLYYSPDDLGTVASLHQITVRLNLPATSNVGSINYRRTYVGIRAR